MGKRVDITGQKFGRWTAIEDVGEDSRHSRLWSCKCACGAERVIRAGALRHGLTKSCGCLKAQVTADRNYVHGQRDTPEYAIWSGVINRCNDPEYKDYGDRGIRVCRGWRHFPNFYADVGRRPGPKHSIDRIDNEGHYSCGKCPECLAHGWPMNCRWATRHQQARNKRNNLFLEFDGVRLCLKDWCERLHVNYSTAKDRIRRGLSIKQALGIGA